MEEKPDLRAGFQMGAWTVLPNQNRIERAPDAIHLEPKVMEVLCVLARNQGEVVTRNALIEEVWSGTFVTDEVLSRAISVLRSQLGDDSKNPEYVVTVPKVGYRLIKPVTTLSSQIPESEPPPARAPERRWLIPAAISTALLLLAGLILFDGGSDNQVVTPAAREDLSAWFDKNIRRNTAPEAMTEIAVLPFDNLSEQAGNDFISDGLTDEIIYSLGKVDGLKVVARSSSLSFRKRYEDVRDIGNILQVQGVVEGTVKRQGNRIRIGAQLSSTRDGYVLWSHTFERNLSDLLSLQEQISAEIVSALSQELGLTAQQEIASPARPPDMKAYQLYLEGRFLWKLRGESPLRKSIQLYQQALELDPGFTRARLALANSLILLPYYSAEQEEAQFALALDTIEPVDYYAPAEAGAAEAIRGFVAFRRWQWQVAEEHFQSSLALAPGNPNTYVWYSQMLSAVGRKEDALKAALQARDLDSVSPVVVHRLATAYLWNDNNVHAAELFARGAELGFVNELSPAYLIFLLRMERWNEAKSTIGHLYRRVGVDPGWMIDNIEIIASPESTVDLREEAQDAVARGNIYPRIELGLWLYLNQPDLVRQVLAKYSEAKKFIDVEFLFAPEGDRFRESGEFEEVTQEMGLKAYWSAPPVPTGG